MALAGWSEVTDLPVVAPFRVTSLNGSTVVDVGLGNSREMSQSHKLDCERSTQPTNNPTHPYWHPGRETHDSLASAGNRSA